MSKFVKTTMKAVSNVEVKRLSDKEVLKCTNNAIIRAISAKALGRKYDKTTNTIINIQSYVENIPRSDRFNHFDTDIITHNMEYYRQENQFIDWKDVNETVEYKGKTTIIDKRKQISLLNNINDNLKNECYLYIYKFLTRIKKYDKMKQKLATIKNKKILEYYNLLKDDKDFNTFLSNISYYDIKGSNSTKKYKMDVLVFKLAFTFSRIMLETYNERSYSTYKQSKYQITYESIDGNEDLVNSLSYYEKGYDNIEVYDKLIKSLSESELNILNDIKKGLKYVDIQTKYQISSKTIAKLTYKVKSLLCPDVYVKTKKIIDKENQNIVKGIENRKLLESQGIKVDNRFNYVDYDREVRQVKYDFVGNLNKRVDDVELDDTNE